MWFDDSDGALRIRIEVAHLCKTVIHFSASSEKTKLLQRAV